MTGTVPLLYLKFRVEAMGVEPAKGDVIYAIITVFVSAFALATTAVVLFAVLLGAAMVGFLSADIPLSVVAIEVYRIVDTPLLVALPLVVVARGREDELRLAPVQAIESLAERLERENTNSTH